MAAGLFLGSGTAIAAPATVVPAASAVSSGGGTGGEACAQLPGTLADLLCPTAGGEDQGTSGNGGGAAAGGTGGSSASSAPAGGTSGTAATPGASGSGAPAQGGPVSNFLAWLAGLFQSVGL